LDKAKIIYWFNGCDEMVRSKKFQWKIGPCSVFWHAVVYASQRIRPVDSRGEEGKNPAASAKQGSGNAAQ